MSIANLFVDNYSNIKAKTFACRELSTTDRNALTPVDGMMVYDTTLDAFYFRMNGVWVKLSSNIPYVDKISVCKASITNNLSISNHATETVKPLTQNFTTNTNIILNGTNGEFLIGLSGTYSISLSIKAQPTSSMIGGPSNNILMTILQNANPVSVWSALGPTTGQTNIGTFPMVISTTTQLVAGDVVTVTIQFDDANTGGNQLQVEALYSEINVALIAPAY